MEIEWHKLMHASAKFAASPVFRDLPGRRRARRSRPPRQWRQSILDLPAAEQTAAVSEVIVAQLAATLGMTAKLDPARPLTELGMDSLMAVELKARIEAHTGTELPFNLFSADLNAERLAERFLKQMSAPTPAAKPAPAPRSDHRRAVAVARGNDSAG